MDLANAKKVSVAGNSGSGKSTQSRVIGKALEIEVFTVDKIYWQHGWKQTPHEEYKKIHEGRMIAILMKEAI
ncbi:MAG: hypothetical protein ABW157_05465 [Candidatus Thiodiazotropha sp. LLP2]